MDLGEQIIIGVIATIGLVVSTLFILALRSLFANTVAVKILTDKMEQLVRSVNEIPKIKSDLNNLGSSVKEIKLKLKEN